MKNIVLIILTLLLATQTHGQAIQPDLSVILKDQDKFVQNRKASALPENGRTGIHLDAGAGEGVAWIPDVTFKNGVIEVELRGRDQPGQSFVGIAFNGSDSDTFECVYVRPFNFQARNPTRRSRSIQYVFHPDYPWSRLREEHPGVYEAAIDPAPDPEAWIHVRLVVEETRVRAYVNDADEPALTVDRIGEAIEGNVGLWVGGNNSEGDYANLRIVTD